MQYPLPSYAASIWLDGETLWLSFPGERHGHSIHLSADEYGLRCALSILRERELAKSAPTINQPGAPTQALAQEMLRAMAKPASQRAEEIRVARVEIMDELRELGL
jgi:hypothetical protein